MSRERAGFTQGGRRQGRFPFLPDDDYIGWTPYAWLVYLPIFLIQPVLASVHGNATTGHWVVTVLGIALFLVSYFRVHWADGRELFGWIAFQVALGVMYAPTNPGSSVFLVYAACFAAQIDRSRTALRTILLIGVAGAATAWATSAPLYFWISAAILAPLIGAVLLPYARAQRATRQLLRAQQEIEHLAKVAERERIARDLHDVLGHTLSLVVLKAELAGKLLAGDPERASREMADVETVARRALQDVRLTIRGYRATVAGELKHAAAILGAAGIRCEAVTDPISADPAVEETLALALREAATNVVRHSGAGACFIRVTSDADAWFLTVSDDGHGIDDTPGSGLLGMHERVAVLHGTLECRPGPRGRGTELRVRIPADGADRHDAAGEAAGLSPETISCPGTAGQAR